MLIPVFIPENSPNRPLLLRALDFVNHFQSQFYCKPLSYDANILPTRESYVSPGDQVVDTNAVWTVIRAKGQSYPIFFTDIGLDNNFFSLTYPEASLITTHSWSECFAPPSLKAFAACEIVLSFICFLGEWSRENIDGVALHESRGCLFDFCRQKSEIRFKLAAGFISPETAAKLTRFGVPDDAIASASRVLENIRLEAIGRSPAINLAEAFIVMKFTEGDENACAFEQGIRPAIQEFGLKPLRADEDPQMRMISTKVLEHVDRARLVVVKLDEPNKNVFFELGYAIARRKDILLIANREQIANVPTDVKGWELLTYRTGDYAGLRSEIQRYLKRLLPHRT